MADAWVPCELAGRRDKDGDSIPVRRCTMRESRHPLSSQGVVFVSLYTCDRCPVPAALALIPAATDLLNFMKGDLSPQEEVRLLAALERARNEARAAVEKAKGTPDAKV